jgi:hypothetical protein
VNEACYLTLACAMDDLASSGFIEHFGVRGDELRSFDSGRRFSARQVVVREYHRFEGVSDPDDMAIVYAIEGEGGVRGTLVDAFGAYSDPTVSAFLAGVPIRGARRFNGGTTGRPWVFDRHGEMGPQRTMGARKTVREPSRFGYYHHGVPAPVAPWHDEGGESGGVT